MHVRTKASIMHKRLQGLALLVRVEELCESRGGRPNEPYGFCGRKATLNHVYALVTVCP